MSFAENFEELKIWQEARCLCNCVYDEVATLRDYDIKNQLQRASVSVMNNIAEGFERRTKGLSGNKYCKMAKAFWSVARRERGAYPLWSVTSTQRSQRPKEPARCDTHFLTGPKKDFAHFLDLSKGSAGEVRSMLYLAEDRKYLPPTQAQKLRESYKRLSSSIGHL